MAHDGITLIIVYGTNKRLVVQDSQTILAVKVAAMALFGIAEPEKDQYVLRAKVTGEDEQLDEAKTVEAYELHDEQKVTLAAGTPFGTV